MRIDMKSISLVCLTIFFISCNNNIFQSSYRGQNNYRNFYLVDTIVIDTPIVISYMGARFIAAKKLLDTIKINDNFRNRPDVFILGQNIYSDLDPKDYKKYSYPDDGNCEIKRSNILSHLKNIETYEFSDKSVKFILGLINVNYYNVGHNAENYYQIRIKEQKNSFYKIVYPLCK